MAKPDALYDLAAELLLAVADALRTVHPLPEGVEEGERGDTMPQELCVVPGPPAFESCCSGQVTVHVEQVYPTTEATFPAPIVGNEVCVYPEMAVTYVVTALRCSPVEGSGDLGGPGCAELGPLAQLVYRDAWAVTRGVLCQLAAWREDDQHPGTVQVLTPIEDEGACIGYELRVQVMLGDPCPCTNPVLPTPDEG